MRKKFIYNIIGLAFLIAGITACDTASQDPSAIVEPDDSYPMVTYTQELTNTTVSEGDTVVLYTIEINKPIVHPLTFNAIQTGGTASGDDYEIISATIPGWSTTGQMTLIVPEGWQGEEAETLDLEVRLTSDAERYLIHPNSTQSASISLTITNNDYPVEVMSHVDGGEVAPDGEVSIYFDGPVTYVEGKTIRFSDVYGYLPDEVINSSDDMTFEGGEYILDHNDFWEWTTIEMTVEAGAFIDAEGNENLETTFEFDIPFYVSSYAGDYEVDFTENMWGDTGIDTVSVVVVSADDNIIGVPDLGGWLDETDNFDNIELMFNLYNNLIELQPIKTDLYLNYYSLYGYYLEDASWYWDPALTESSQIIIRDWGAANNTFNEVTFGYSFIYEVYGDLIKGDGSAFTSGTQEVWSCDYNPVVKGSKATASAERTFSNIKIVGEEMMHGKMAYKVELVK